MTHPLLRSAHLVGDDPMRNDGNLPGEPIAPTRVIARLAREVTRLQGENHRLRLHIAAEAGQMGPDTCAIYNFDGAEDFLVCTDADAKPIMALFIPDGREDQVWF